MTIVEPDQLLGRAGPADRVPCHDLIDRLATHLDDVLIPYWLQAGVDARGGFFEVLDHEGAPVEALRRARLVARQIFVFSSPFRRDRASTEAERAVTHGFHFLRSHLVRDDGHVSRSCRVDGTVVDGNFDLYDTAFVLFALAAMWRVSGEAEVRDLALRVQANLDTHWRSARGGYLVSSDRQHEALSNPHMHLLEAYLAWAASGPAGLPAAELADAVAHLAFDKLIDPVSGGIAEVFDLAWTPRRARGSLELEPGHQFEWAWLLGRWGDECDHPEVRGAAERLRQVGEERGVDGRRGVAVNLVDEHGRVLDAAAKIWPQTERVKAWSRWEGVSSRSPMLHAGALTDACGSLVRYVEHQVPGHWYEVMSPQGHFQTTDTRASSLYHIVSAVETLTEAAVRAE